MGRLQAQPPPTVLYLQAFEQEHTVAHYLLVISVAKQHLDSGLHKVDAEEKNCCYFFVSSKPKLYKPPNGKVKV